MSRSSQMRLLFILIGVVPLAVGGAGLASFLLLRAGYGIAVWALLPLLGLLAFAVVLGAVLGRRASGTGKERSADGEEPRREDD